MNDFIEKHQGSYLYNIVSLARQMENPYLKFYDNLISQYETPDIYAKALRNEFHESLLNKFNEAIEKDSNSKLGVYKLINPDLSKPTYFDIPEFERTKITRYRCGAHYLEIEKGRMEGKKREDRLCKCSDVQTLNLLQITKIIFTGVGIPDGLCTLDGISPLNDLLWETAK
jgi:hypothetical protein